MKLLIKKQKEWRNIKVLWKQQVQETAITPRAGEAKGRV